MLFNSYIFIFLFLPLALLGWYGLNRCRAYEMAKLFLAVMSLWFYGYFNLYYLFVILGSILVNYLLSFLLKKFSSPKVCRAGLWAGVLLNLGILFYFKYYDFFFENVKCLLISSSAVIFTNCPNCLISVGFPVIPITPTVSL